MDIIKFSDFPKFENSMN